MNELFTNFVHEVKHEIRANSYAEFLHEKLVTLRMACAVETF